MQAQRLAVAVVLWLLGAFVGASCARSPEAMPGTGDLDAGVGADAGSHGDVSAAERARHDLDDHMTAVLQRWSVYTIQPLPSGGVYGAGCREHTFVSGWIYLSTAHDWDKRCQLVAVPEGGMEDPRRWVKFSMTELVAKGAFPYFMGLLEGGLSFADLLGITVALAASEDEVPALPGAVGSALGRMGASQPGRDVEGLRAPGHYPGEPPPSRELVGRLPPPPLWPRRNSPAKRQWEGALASFFNQLMDDPARDQLVAKFRSSPRGQALCQPHVGSGLVEADLRFPEVAAFMAACGGQYLPGE